MACKKRGCACKCGLCRPGREGRFVTIPGTTMSVRSYPPEQHCWKHRRGCHVGCSSHG